MEEFRPGRSKLGLTRNFAVARSRAISFAWVVERLASGARVQIAREIAPNVPVLFDLC